MAIKVLHVYKTFFPETFGGVEQNIIQLCKSIVSKGVESKIVTIANEAGVIFFDTIEIHRYKKSLEIASCPFSMGLLLNFKKHAEWADIIHYHYPWPFSDVLHLLLNIKKPSILTYHSDIVKQKFYYYLYKFVEKKFLASMNVIVATSLNYLNSSKNLTHYNKKVQVIPIGLDEKEYPMPVYEKIQHWRNKLGDNFFLFIGVLRYYKGLHTLLEAVKNTNHKLVVIGDGPERKSLERKISSECINNTIMLGSLSEVDKVAVLSLSKALVLPSHLRSEAYGISLLEGAMMSKPLISCYIGTGTSYINVDRVTGIVVKPGDPIELSKAMDYLSDNKKARIMGQNARHRFDELFTADVMSEEYKKIYISLVMSKL